MLSVVAPFSVGAVGAWQKKSFADEPELFLQFVVFANYPTKDDEKNRENVSKRDIFLEGRSKSRHYKHHFCVIYTFE